MARRDRTDTSSPAQAIVASARRVKLTDKEGTRRQVLPPSEWQNEAWRFYNMGEVKYPLNYRANAVSRLRLFAAVRPEPDQEPIPVSDPRSGIDAETARRADDALDRLKAEVGGQRAIVKAYTLNQDVAGECYLVGEEAVEEVKDANGKVTTAGHPERWGIYSVSALKIGTDGTVKIQARRRYGGTDQGRVLPDTAMVVRMWTPDAEYPDDPDCELRGVLEKLDELGILGRMIRTQGRARLNAGILFLNQDLDFKRPTVVSESEGQGDGQAKEDDPFANDLMRAITTPIQDEGDASAYVPMIIRGKGDQIGKDKNWHLALDRPIDEQAVVLRKELRQGVAEGMPVPVEVSTGLSDTNHWSAWQITEDTFRSHIEPAGIGLCEAFTAGYLRPMLTTPAELPGGGQLAAVDEETANRIFVWYDPAELVVKPNRAQDAKDAHKAMVISDAELRDALSFPESSAPDEDEVARRIAITRGLVDSPLTEALLALLLPEVVKASQENRAAAAPADAIDADSTDTTPAAPAEPGPPEGDGSGASLRASASPSVGERLAVIDQTLATRVEVAATMALERALEKAGARLRSKANGNAAVRASITKVPQVAVAATMGPALVSSFGVTEDELLEGSFDHLEAQFLQWVEQAQEAAAAVIAATWAVDPGAIDQYRLDAADARTEAWAWTRAALVSLARVRLYDPDPAAPELGEHDPTMSIPMPLIREALTRCGGMHGVDAQPITAATGWAADYMAAVLSTSNGTKPSGLTATGQNAKALAQSADAVVDRYEWAYAAMGGAARAFPGHRQLNGVRFSGYDDPRVAVQAQDSWLPWPYYAAGDHRGCRCMTIPVWEGGRSLISG